MGDKGTKQHQHIETPLGTIEETFIEYTKRKDIAIILINQHVSFVSGVYAFFLY